MGAALTPEEIRRLFSSMNMASPEERRLIEDEIQRAMAMRAPQETFSTGASGALGAVGQIGTAAAGALREVKARKKLTAHDEDYKRRQLEHQALMADYLNGVPQKAEAAAALTNDPTLGRIAEFHKTQANQQQQAAALASENNPNSASSTFARARARKLGMNVPDDATAAGLKPWLEQYGKDYSADTTAKTAAERLAFDKDKEKTALPEKLRSRADSLRQGYLGNQSTKQMQELATAVGNARVAPDNGGGDLVLIYALAKALDPGGRVTDSDFMNVAQSGGLPGLAQSYFQQFTGKGRLGDGTRKEVMQAINAVAAKRLESHRAFEESFGRLADKDQIPREDVVVDLGFGGLGGPSSPAPGLSPAEAQRLQELEAKAKAGALK